MARISLPNGWVSTTDPTDNVRVYVGPLGEIVKRDGIPSVPWTCYYADDDYAVAPSLSELFTLIGY